MLLRLLSMRVLPTRLLSKSLTVDLTWLALAVVLADGSLLVQRFLPRALMQNDKQLTPIKFTSAQYTAPITGCKPSFAMRCDAVPV